MDIVANHMILAGIETYGKAPELIADVSNRGTSYQNPCKLRQVQMAFGHFRDYPSPNAAGPPTFRMIDSRNDFRLSGFFGTRSHRRHTVLFAELIRDPAISKQ